MMIVIRKLVEYHQKLRLIITANRFSLMKRYTKAKNNLKFKVKLVKKKLMRIGVEIL